MGEKHPQSTKKKKRGCLAGGADGGAGEPEEFAQGRDVVAEAVRVDVEDAVVQRVRPAEDDGLMDVEVGEVEMQQALLHDAELAAVLAVAHKVLHDDGRQRGDLVVADQWRQLGQEGRLTATPARACTTVSPSLAEQIDKEEKKRTRGTTWVAGVRANLS